ncbi:hypothetical protein PWY87_28495 [Kribbella solani]|uniref:hypothetical protein n=1 Tax=Kribbella solani TaxID=236067 RepID=UPI0029BC344E|nr:hypothetical protein [Kribbella solani]MDX3005653.1 hypothetical protein [Kribbella solani]
MRNPAPSALIPSAVAADVAAGVRAEGAFCLGVRLDLGVLLGLGVLLELGVRIGLGVVL